MPKDLGWLTRLARKRTKPVPEPGAPPVTLPPPPTGHGIFGPRSVYAQDLTSAPVAANSAAVVGKIVRAAVTAPYGVGVNFSGWTCPLYLADANTPSVQVFWDDHFQQGGPIPEQIAGTFSGIPIPRGAIPSRDSDHHLAVYCEATDQLWELWNVSFESDIYRDVWGFAVKYDIYHATWGGRIDRLSQSDGVFPGATGAGAGSLALVGTMVTLDDVRRGEINHAIGIALPALAADRWAYPAHRTDGTSSDPDAPLMGQRFRLDPAIDVAALGLTGLGAMVAKAAQRYGFIANNSSYDVVSINMESSLPALQAGQPDPWTEVMAKVPRGDYLLDDWDQLKGFPWHRLEAVEPNWRPGA